ncbi:MAG TPA: hypothetical protein VHB77_07050 [Planctomycetaceae bacterium]|nr:hypothetical protein [Planctomycetaceae bacterium]
MFRVLTSSLTTVALLAHVLLGCCWHHRHEHADHPAVCETHEHEQHAAAGEHSHSHACDAHSDCHEHDSPVCMHTGPCSHHHTCTGVACSYLAAKVLKAERFDCQDLLCSIELPSAAQPARLDVWNAGSDAPANRSCTSGLRCALLQSWQV